MIITYVRSSSMGDIDLCEQSFFIKYGLAEKGETGLAAIKGSVFHKVMELFALCKVAVQNKEQAFKDDETGFSFNVDTFSAESSMDLVFDYFRAEFPKLKPRDKKECLEWVNKALEYRKGEYNPMNQEIIKPEQFFDFPIEREWARIPGTDEYLRVRGTIDLVSYDLDKRDLVVLDYKTGKRINWKTGKEKDYKYFYKDPQLRLYHYACSKIFPEARTIFMKIYYVNDGGPFMIPFGPENIPETEKMIESYYKRMTGLKNPKLLNAKPCWTFCYFGKNRSPHDPDKTICKFYKDRIKEIGIDNVVDQYADKAKLNTYDGGGRTNIKVD